MTQSDYALLGFESAMQAGSLSQKPLLILLAFRRPNMCAWTWQLFHLYNEKTALTDPSCIVFFVQENDQNQRKAPFSSLNRTEMLAFSAPRYPCCTSVRASLMPRTCPWRTWSSRKARWNTTVDEVGGILGRTTGAKTVGTGSSPCSCHAVVTWGMTPGQNWMEWHWYLVTICQCVGLYVLLMLRCVLS